MAPRPDVRAASYGEPPLDGSEVVISGISGRYPKSHSVKELQENLFAKTELVSECPERWKTSVPDVSNYLGMITDLEKFDAQFFGVHYKQSENMEPVLKKTLEACCEAIIDAGVNPRSLRGEKVGVFVGGTNSENERQWIYDSRKVNGYGLTGTCRAMYANRISYWLGVTAPSYALDGADGSGTMALEQAVSAIEKGLCHSAVVGCSNISLHPNKSLSLSRMGFMSKDASTKSFSEDGVGYARGECVNILFLQKARNAKRAYAQIVAAKTDFKKLKFDEHHQYMFPTGPELKEFLHKFYEEINVDPTKVQYVEANGLGLPQTDKEEIEALDDVFCSKKRDQPLMVGSIIPNIGNTECARGLSSLMKVLIAYHTGKIPANLHTDNPLKIDAFESGRIRLVKDEVAFNKGYTAINQFSHNGIVSHVLLKEYEMDRIIEPRQTSMPEVVCISGRTENSITAAFADLESKPLNAGQLALLREAYNAEIPGFMIRSYNVLAAGTDKKSISLSSAQNYYGGDNRPVWFVYSGMGSQWTTMGSHLMNIPVFREAIEKCHKVLEPYGEDLISVLTSDDKTIFDNIKNSFIGIAAVQTGLTDVLKAVGIVPTNIIGHSVGELGCAYADGCLTAEQMIMAAYCRGLVSLQTPLIKGAMAAVGVGYNTVKHMLPEDIEVACHNGPESCTISGPADSMKTFVEELTSRGIFAKQVPTSNIAYHSRYIAPAGPNLLKYMKDVIKHPKERSSKWVSTSVPQARWDEDIVKTCSPEYLTNNLLSPVLFEETSQLIPSNAIVIEIAPHGLLQAILKRSLSADCVNIPLTRRGHSNNVHMVLDAIGKMYMVGLNPQVQNLYPQVQYPVPPETPYIAHMLKWNHDENWRYLKYNDECLYQTTERVLLISRLDDNYKYMNDYVLGDTTYIPPAAILVLVWETLGMVSNIPYRKLQVQFQKVRFDGDIQIPPEDTVELTIIIQRASGCFEVMVDNTAVVSGIIENKQEFSQKSTEVIVDTHKSILNSDDIYRIFSNRGHHYKNQLRSLESVTQDFTKGTVSWDGTNWVAMLDAVMQMSMLHIKEGISKPKFIESLIIDLKTMFLVKPKRNETTHVDIDYSPVLGLTRCYGIELRHMVFDVNVNTDSRLWQQILTCKHSLKNEAALYSPAANQRLSIAIPGDLENLIWLQTEAFSKTKQNLVSVIVHYARISYLDLMKAQGRIMPGYDISNDQFGMSFSGVTQSGVRVMGLVKSGAVSNVVEADPELLWPVPEHWTMEEAATVPQAYAQAFYCLTQRTQLERNSTVLITSGAGAFGQAVISVCLSLDCEVFTTVSDARKKRLLTKLFPQLKESNIINTREENVTDVIGLATDGKGCHLVINNSHGIQRRSLLMQCTENTFMDINVEDMIDGSYFGMGFLFASDMNYFTALFANIFDEKNETTRRNIRNLIYKNINDGYVRPINHVTFEAKEVTRAFKLISARRNHGPVLVRMENKQAITSPIASWKCSDGAYVVVCGKKNLGVEVADTLVKMGAKNLLVHTDEPNMGFLQLKMSDWKQQGVTVMLTTGSINDQSLSNNLLTSATKMGQLNGIFIIAPDDKSKNEDMINLIRNLDSATSYNISKEFKYVVLTSLTEADKDAACFAADVEAVCNRRVRSGLHAKLISCLPKAKVDGDLNVIEMSSILTQVSCKFNIIVNTVDQPAISLVPMSRNLEKSLLDYITSIIGLGADGLTEDLKATTLGQLGIDLPTAKCLSLNIHMNYGICLTPQIILTTPLSKFDDKTVNATTSRINADGLSAYFTYCNPDEHEGTEPLWWMPTIVNPAELVIEGANDEDYMIVLPGLEGNAERLRALCRRLKLRALMCNFCVNTTEQTVTKLAEELTKKIYNMIGVNKRYYIMGSSFGCLLALEMASIFEKNGHYGKVFCLDGSPYATPKIFDHDIGVTSYHQLQNEFLQHFSSIITNEPCDELKSILKSETNLTSKIERCLGFVRNKTTLTSEYICDLLKAGWLRLEQQKMYKPVDLKIESPIVLIKASSELDLPEDYGLQQFTSGKVTVYNLDTSHYNIVKDVNINNVINQELDKDILDKFDATNLCTLYVDNGI